MEEKWDFGKKPDFCPYRSSSLASRTACARLASMTQNYYQWTSSPVLPPCYGIFGYTGVDCQLVNTRHNQEFEIQARILKDSLDRLSSKVDSLCTHNKMLEIQIPQVASPSQTSRIFPSQPKANPKGQMNDITRRNGRQLEDLVVETKTDEVEVESEKPQSEKVVVESEKPNISPPYEPKIPFPQEYDESKLEEKFRKLIANIQEKLPSKLKDPESFFEPYVIGSEIIERAMKSGRSDIHRSPQRAMNLASRVMIFIARHASLSLRLASSFGNARHSEQPYSP
ncbi:hypothetical protein MTR_0560s0010 [Medicago truncatula]|uniref:Uncharacterized protein n=1 Tax=Medicago truncatula TaxID=3880 RepID=A0A072TQD9_MEDTR|nr:hypothetical protein MTR_0560s0010 [Medicago truncatula]